MRYYGVNVFQMKDRFVCNSLIFTPPLFNSLGNIGADSSFCFISISVPADLNHGGADLFVFYHSLK